VKPAGGFFVGGFCQNVGAGMAQRRMLALNEQVEH